VTNGPAEPDRVAESRRDAWATLCDLYRVRVWRYVARIIGADADAVADAVQETFLAAARNYGQFDPQRGSTWAWLTGIAHRQAALHWRRIGRDRIHQAGPSIEKASTEEASTDDSTTSPLELAETVNIVRRVLAELPPDSAAVLMGKYCDGCSVTAVRWRN
jgi:RNA polymerase sigma factor (sigma-70 family)